MLDFRKRKSRRAWRAVMSGRWLLETPLEEYLFEYHLPRISVLPVPAAMRRDILNMAGISGRRSLP
jgi:hypothetical protein